MAILVRFSFLKLRQKRNKIMFFKQNRPEAKTKEQNQESVAEVKLYSLSAVSLPTYHHIRTGSLLLGIIRRIRRLSHLSSSSFPSGKLPVRM